MFRTRILFDPALFIENKKITHAQYYLNNKKFDVNKRNTEEAKSKNTPPPNTSPRNLVSSSTNAHANLD